MDKVFKYRDLQSAGTTKMLKDFELLFTEPGTFNDPFDSFVEFDNAATLQDWENYFKKVGMPPDKVKQGVDNIKRGVKIDLSSLQQPAMLKISCFSEEPDNMLLWSHYGNKHTGICIGFKVYQEFKSNCIHLNSKDLAIDPSLPQGTIPLFKVDYNINMPRPYNRITEDPKRLMEFVTTKSKNWEYEKEYRAIVYSSIVINNPIHFDPSEITDLVFGINTTKSDIQDVKNIVSTYPSCGNWINLFKCERLKSKYEIILVKI